MPNNIIKTFADKTDKTVEEVEVLWKKAEQIVKDEYEIDSNDESYYPLVVGVLKKSLGFKSEDFSIGVGDIGLTNVPDGGPGMGVRINKGNKKTKKHKKSKTFLEYLKRSV
tara:strand:+ start:1169 stop:1501 length:333 start_codon:yes stop_codon:yes gene_type:complete